MEREREREEGRRCSALHVGILTELDAGKYGRATQF